VSVLATRNVKHGVLQVVAGGVPIGTVSYCSGSDDGTIHVGGAAPPDKSARLLVSKLKPLPISITVIIVENVEALLQLWRSGGEGGEIIVIVNAMVPIQLSDQKAHPALEQRKPLRLSYRNQSICPSNQYNTGINVRRMEQFSRPKYCASNLRLYWSSEEHT
jgi:hypothetical protein